MPDITPTGTRHIVPLSYLSGWDKNPRSIKPKDLERLKDQIKQLGQYKPLLATKDGTVIGGNMRLKAYQSLGIESVWVSLIEFEQSGANWIAIIDGKKQSKVFTTKEQAMLEYALSDNDRAGYYDDEMLGSLTMQFPDMDFNQYAIDMAAPRDLSSFIERKAQEAEDESPEPEAGESESKAGELYMLGRHRLLCGDATNEADITHLMGGRSADMVFTDPPYNVDYTGKTKEALKIENDKWKGDQFYTFLVDSLKNALGVCQGAFYICMSSSELHRLRPAFEEAGGKFSCFIIWAKNNFTLGRGDWQQQYEPILYGWNAKNKAHYFVGFRDEGNLWRNLESLKPKFEAGKTTINIGPYTFELDGEVKGRVMTKHVQTDVWEIKRPSASREHPTMKPIRLCSKAIKSSSLPDQIVLDPFGGSGSTLIAAHKTERICYTIELDPHYCDVIRKRYATLIGRDDWQAATPKVDGTPTN